VELEVDFYDGVVSRRPAAHLSRVRIVVHYSCPELRSAFFSYVVPPFRSGLNGESGSNF